MKRALAIEMRINWNDWHIDDVLMENWNTHRFQKREIFKRKKKECWRRSEDSDQSNSNDEKYVNERFVCFFSRSEPKLMEIRIKGTQFIAQHKPSTKMMMDTGRWFDSHGLLGTFASIRECVGRNDDREIPVSLSAGRCHHCKNATRSFQGKF